MCMQCSNNMNVYIVVLHVFSLKYNWTFLSYHPPTHKQKHLHRFSKLSIWLRWVIEWVRRNKKTSRIASRFICGSGLFGCWYCCMPYILYGRHFASTKKAKRAETSSATATANANCYTEWNIHTAKVEWQHLPKELTFLQQSRSWFLTYASTGWLCGLYTRWSRNYRWK